jgi:TPP-dependent pyruvate/acetoin dehydrogenase alpha subunit
LLLVLRMPLIKRGDGYGIPGKLVDGMNALDVYGAASETISRAKRGEGPTLVECETYRYRAHGMYDTGLYCRTERRVLDEVRMDLNSWCLYEDTNVRSSDP